MKPTTTLSGIAWASVAAALIVAAGCDDPFNGGEGPETWMVSVDSSGRTGNDDSLWPTISADGNAVAFGSNATNLVAGDTNGCCDAFVHYLDTGETIRIPEGPAGNDHATSFYDCVISGDAGRVAFYTEAALLSEDTNPGCDVYVYDIGTRALELVSVDSSGEAASGGSWMPAISGDGRHVAFLSDAPDLVSGDTNGLDDVFVFDRQTGRMERASVSSLGAEPDGKSRCPSITPDGRFVAFVSEAANLVAGTSTSRWRVYVRDRQTSETELVGSSSAGISFSEIWYVGITDDGRYVAFDSEAPDLVTGDTNGAKDIFVYDRDTGETVRASVDSSGIEANDRSGEPSISADGRFVAFDSWATNLVPGDGNEEEDIYVHDLQTGETARISLNHRGEDPNYGSWSPRISADGRFIVYQSGAADLVTFGFDYEVDIFVTRNPLAP